MNRILNIVRRLTIEQWDALVDEYQPEGAVSAATIRRVLGAYLVIALVLYARRFVHHDVFAAVWASLPEGEDRLFYKKHIWLWTNTFIFSVPPYLYARFVLGLKLRELGFTAHRFMKHLPIYLAFVAVVFPLAVVVSETPAFMADYPIYKDAGLSLRHLLVWELSYGLYFIALEFFFRGFMLFGTTKAVGVLAIPIMTVPYMMLHYPKPELECLGSIIAGMALGVVALRTRSILAGILIHIGIAWSMDLLVLDHRDQLLPLLPF